MKTIEYPLLCYELPDQSVLGILVGTKYQAVEKDIRKLKSTLGDYIYKQYKKHDSYYYMDIVEPRFKMEEFKIRPTFRDERGAFPISQILKVPIPIIFGETDRGYYECYIPLLKESFFYYEPKQFKSLLQYFTINLLNGLSPAKLNRLMLMNSPTIDSVTLKVNENRTTKWKPTQFERRYKVLERLAERYPQSKVLRRNLSALPEAAWELEDKVEELVDKLIRNKSNLLIVGQHGVGKTAVLRQGIKKIATKARKEKTGISFWRMIPQRFTATSKYLGEWQETCELLVEELRSASGVLWVEDIIRLLQLGGGGPEDSVAAYLISFLQSGRLQLIGEVTEQELESMRSLLPGFVQNFQLIKIEELAEQKIQKILSQFSTYAKQNLKIEFSDQALNLAYRLLLRYYPYESFPGKAVKFLGQCISEAQLQEANKIGQKEVIDNFIIQTGLSKLFLRDDLLLDPTKLTQFFEKKIIGQYQAIDKLCSVVKIYKAGLNNPNKPIATMLFAGPTGVGKTASAKALADYFFGKAQKKSPLVRIDMSEFQHPGQIHQFIGAGKEVGKLIQEIRERPFSVLLLDEVEKAHSSIFDALLSVLDEGVLVDAFGRVTNFRNTIIIMTSNLGASNRQPLGFTETTSDEAKYSSAVSKFFRPEFINRIDEIVLFGKLKKKDIIKITIKELSELNQREGIVKRKLKLEFDDSVVKRISTIGFDERYGARPLQRAIEDFVVNPIANWLLENPKISNQILKISFDKELIVSV